MLTATQLEARKAGIGGSDAAAVLGLNPYTSPLDLYNDKLGLTPSKDLSANDAVYWGNVLEDVVAKEYARRTGSKVRVRNQQFQHKDHTFMLANIDRSVDGQRRILECKTAGAFAAKPDQWGQGNVYSADGVLLKADDKVPESYLIQCAHYMAVLDYDVADLAVLIGGRDFRIYTIQRDLELERMLIQKESEFWMDHVELEIPPSPTRISDIEEMYAQDNGGEVQAAPEIIDSLIQLEAVKTEQTKLKQRQEALETEIKTAMDENQKLVGIDGSLLATWKTTKPRTTFDATRFKKEHPELAEQYLKAGKASRRFSIK